MKGLIMVYGKVIDKPQIISDEVGKEVLRFTISDQEATPTLYICVCKEMQMFPKIKQYSILAVNGVFATRKMYKKDTDTISTYHLIITDSIAVIK